MSKMRPMRTHFIRGLLAAILLFQFSAHSQTFPTTQPQADVEQLSRDVHFLASDETEGRGIGTHGLDLAADYIAARFHALGLSPLASYPDYFQPFQMNDVTIINSATDLETADHKFELGKQYVPLRFSAQGKFSGSVVFAGFGISSEEHHYDDYDGIDVKNKIVLIMRYEPHNADGSSRFAKENSSPLSTFIAKSQAAAAHGAIAILLVNPPIFHGDDRLIPITRGGAKSSLPYLQITQSLANNLLKQAGGTKSLEELQKQIDTTAKPTSFDLNNVHLSGNVDFIRGKADVKNVLAYLPGKTHRDEFIVVGAHYDHLGHGTFGGDDIYHGADDNASGTAAVMEMAKNIAESGPRDRSIIFICFTGEEEGLVGSDYFLKHCPIDPKQIVAMLNMDMVGRVRNEILYTAGEGTANALEPILKSADEGLQLRLKSIGKGGLGPSDHQSFAMKKIPVLFFFSGMHSDYHRPTDLADKINYHGLTEVTEFSRRIVDALTTMPRQEYVDRYDSQGLTIAGISSHQRVTLGIVPEYGADESTQGVRISSSENADMRSGDTIVQIDDKKIENLYDLSEFLASAKAGEEVKLSVMRDKQKIELHTTLKGPS
jgi:hypothetical protein